MQDKLQMLQTVMCTVGQIFFLKKKKNPNTHIFDLFTDLQFQNHQE